MSSPESSEKKACLIKFMVYAVAPDLCSFSGGTPEFKAHVQWSQPTWGAGINLLGEESRAEGHRHLSWQGAGRQ